MPKAFQTAALASFVTCSRTSLVYPPGSVLFNEGDQPDGAYILDSGQATLYAMRLRGKTIIRRTARAGEILGLNAVILGKPYLFTAEVTEPSRVSYVRRDEFLAFLRKTPEAAGHVIEQVSRNSYDAQRDLRALKLAPNVSERVAGLLLGWVEASGASTEDEVWLDMDVTHEEIGQMVAASRETVSRVMAGLTRKGVIEVKGHAVRIASVARLRDLDKL